MPFLHQYFLQVRTFCKENNLPPKAILIVDNCTAHGSSVEPIESDDGQIVCYFLPPNVTAILQPMDQGPIKITKLKYRNLLLCKVISQQNETSGSIIDILKKHTIKDAIVLFKKAWDDISISILKTSWKKMLAYDDEDYDPDDLVPLSELQSYSTFVQETQTYLQQLNPNANFTVDDVEQWNRDQVTVNETEGSDDTDDTEEDDDDSACSVVPKTSHDDAINCVNGLLKWCDENQSAKYVSVLLDLRTEIVNAAKIQPKKQTVLSDFFAIQTQK